MTLLEEVERRQRLQDGARARQSRESASSSDPVSEVDLKRGYAVIVSFSMFVVHATLAALARLQYGQDLSIALVCKEAVPSIFIFAALIYFLHPLKSLLVQVIAAASSVGVGCWLVYMVNEEGYYASMHRAPALGSLWVWLFIELEWYYGALSLAAVVAYVKYNAYSLV